MKEVVRARRRGGNCPAAPLAYYFKTSLRALPFGARLVPVRRPRHSFLSASRRKRAGVMPAAFPNWRMKCSQFA